MEKKWCYFWYRIGLFFIPIIISAIFIILVWLGLEQSMFVIIGLLLLSYFISPFGREVLIPVAIISFMGLHGTSQMVLDIALVVIIVVFVDVMCSIFLLWNLDLLKYLPVFGKWIEGIERFGHQKLKNSRKKQQNIFLAITGYVALPFQGSGGIMSTIIGMLTGMTKQRVWLAVWIGSFIGSLTMAILSFSMGQVMIDIFGSTAWYFLGLFLLVSIVIYIILRYRNNRLNSPNKE
ncbi:MAG: small multi-drug export protein [Thermoplasmata archaeon]|nr:small multi-drug export protein [Thermoplasmata archaeon]